MGEKFTPESSIVASVDDVKQLYWDTILIPCKSGNQTASDPIGLTFKDEVFYPMWKENIRQIYRLN